METISEKKVLNKYLQIVIYKCNIGLLIATSNTLEELMNLKGYIESNNEFCIVDTVSFNVNKPFVFDNQFKSIPNCTLVVTFIGHSNVEYEFTLMKEFNVNYASVKLLTACNFMRLTIKVCFVFIFTL